MKSRFFLLIFIVFTLMMSACSAVEQANQETSVPTLMPLATATPIWGIESPITIDSTSFTIDEVTRSESGDILTLILLVSGDLDDNFFSGVFGGSRITCDDYSDSPTNAQQRDNYFAVYFELPRNAEGEKCVFSYGGYSIGLAPFFD